MGPWIFCRKPTFYQDHGGEGDRCAAPVEHRSFVIEVCGLTQIEQLMICAVNVSAGMF